jgi:hypothetical protein
MFMKPFPQFGMRSTSILLLGAGLFWGLVVLGFVALLGGFFGNAPPTDPVIIGKLLLWCSWLFIGPLLLIAGAILMLRGTHPKAGSILSLVGCVILTAMVGNQTLSMLHDLADPLIIKPPFGAYAIAVILTLLADTAAVRLYRKIA